MASTTYDGDPHKMYWYRSVFGGKAEKLFLQHAFEKADSETLFIVPTPMLEYMKGLCFIYKKVALFEWNPETTAPFRPQAYANLDLVYPYKPHESRPTPGAFTDKATRQAMIKEYRERGFVF